MKPNIVTKEIDFKEIEKMWLTEFDRNNKLSLYIDVPFCITVCKFCNQGRFPERVCSDEYNKYFNETLPKHFEINKNILRMKTFDTVYFGGGTSGMMDTKTMKKVFDMIPNIKEIENKKFEANPVLLTEEKIKILYEYRFNQVSLGVQTFNDELLKANNRINIKKEKLKKLIDICHNNKLEVNCDLLTFTEQSGYPDRKVDIKESLKNTYNDILIMDSEIEPDTITLYAKWEMFSFDGKEFKKELEERDIGVRYEINKMALKASRKTVNYRKIQSKDIKLDLDASSNLSNNIIFKHKDVDIIPNKYDSSSYPFCIGSSQNTIALGGYGGINGRSPYSYIQDKIFYEVITDSNRIYYRRIGEEEIKDGK